MYDNTLITNPPLHSSITALAVEHVDALLEDWYPSLGTRFLHTSEGRMLVTRLVPCPRCLTSYNERTSYSSADAFFGKSSWQDWQFLTKSKSRELLAPIVAAARVSQESHCSDRDSGMGQESPRESTQSHVSSFQHQGYYCQT